MVAAKKVFNSMPGPEEDVMSCHVCMVGLEMTGPPFRLQEGAINMVLYLPIAVNILTYFGYESDTLYTIKYNIYIFI